MTAVQIVCLVVMPFAIWRVTRFILRDSMFEETRAKLESRLTVRSGALVWRKLLQLVTCPWCISVWVSIALMAVYATAVAPGLGWGEITIITLGQAGASMAAWRTWEKD